MAKGRLRLFVALGASALCAGAALLALARVGQPHAPAQSARLTLHSAPLAFEPRGGGFLARTADARVAITDRGAMVQAAEGERISVAIAGAARVRPRTSGRLPGVVNSFVGPRSRWHAGIATYRRVDYPSVLPGLDLAFHGSTGRLEYDLTLAPGREPDSVELEIAGARHVRVDRDGGLSLAAGNLRMRQLPPRTYQLVGGRRIPVASRYRITGRNRIGFSVGRYDHTRPLVIDPVISYASYFGGPSSEYVRGVITDAAGAVYVVGRLSTPADGFITKFNPDGSVAYSTYLGGSSSDSVEDLAVDPAGAVYLTGSTTSTDFPTVSPFQATSVGPADAFVAKLDPGGGLAYSSYLGGAGTDNGWGVAVDGGGNAYVAGTTSSSTLAATIPFLLGPGGGSNDLFVAKIDPAGAALKQLTTIGGTADETPNAILLDGAGNVYLGGSTNSVDFPTKAPFQRNPAGNGDGILVELNPALSDFVFSTYLGGTLSDTLNAITLDPAGNIYFAGNTQSPEFKTEADVTQLGINGSQDAVVGELAAGGGKLLWSTFYGGSGSGDNALAVRVDGAGDTWIAGTTNSSDIARPSALQPNYGGQEDAFVAQYLPDRTLAFGTYFGGTGSDAGIGMGLDPSGGVWLAGSTTSPDIPLFAPAQDQKSGGYDGYLAHMTPTPAGQGPPAPQTSAPKAVFAENAVATPGPGTVRVKYPDGGYTRLRRATEIPVGTVIDAAKGRVLITIEAGGKLYAANFSGGVFQFRQPRKLKGTAEMRLSGGTFARCTRRRPTSSGNKVTGNPIRRLWAAGSGPFRIMGRYSSSITKRGTWLTEDRCDSTLTIVKKNSVVVRDLKTRKQKTVKAPRRYLAHHGG